MKNTIKSILLPLIYSFATLVISVLVSSIYVRLNTYYYGYNTIEQINEYFNSDIYKIGINNFLSDNYLYIGLIIFFLFIPYLLKKYYSESVKREKLKLDGYVLIVILGILISGISNLIFYKFNTISLSNNINIMQLLLVTGLIMPILEVYMFQGVIYNNLQKENSKMTSIVITSILFALMHNSLNYMIYSFGLSFLLIYVYEKYRTIKASIVLHIVSNLTTLSFMYILGISDLLNYILLLILTIFLIIYYLMVTRKDRKLGE